MSHVYRALRVEEPFENQFERHLAELTTDDLPDHEVLVRVQYSALNFKDALAASGSKGVTRHYPHTPGIDAAGTVVESRHPDFRPGQAVLVTSYDLGMNTPGGFGQYVRVPAAWVVPLPTGLTTHDAMVLGTAGLTAALARHQMEQMGQTPAAGPILVTGATGGVGSLAVALFARGGYEVVAATGKAKQHDY
ncbi:MAG: alcohol dehydrogenase catalytic domain-containing protein, partial [Catalinimonas sp.]